jgi:hypothetical protein
LGIILSFPSLVFAILMRDVWLEPRSVLTGVVTSKSFQPESQSYGSMHFVLLGYPYDFTALLKIVAVPERQPQSSYRELAKGSTASVTVFSRDVAGTPAAGRVVPALRINQSDRSVYISGELFFGWIIGPILMVAVLGGLFGISVRKDVLAASRAGRLLRTLDHPAQRLAQVISPVREFDPIERQARHDRVLAVGRYGSFIVVCILAMAAYLLVNAVM